MNRLSPNVGGVIAIAVMAITMIWCALPEAHVPMVVVGKCHKGHLVGPCDDPSCEQIHPSCHHWANRGEYVEHVECNAALKD